MKNNFGIYQKDDGGREKYYPKNSHHGDCAIRACAIAAGLDYYDTFKELTDIGLEVGDLANSPQVYPVFLKRHGFKKQTTPRNAKVKKISIREFTAIAPQGRIVVLTRRHLTAIVDNVQRDTWLTEWCCNTWYYKGEQK